MPKFKHSEIEDKDLVGITTGLAWTEVGGELLTIESALSPEKVRYLLLESLVKL